MSIKGRLLLSVVVGLCLPVAALAADAPPQAAAKAAAAKPQVPAKPQVTSKPVPAGVTVAQVIEKHIAARGGLKAWHGVQSMAWNGKMDVGFGDSAARSERYVSNAAMAYNAKQERMALAQADAQPKEEQQVQLPFLLEMKRPDKSRIEVEFAGKTAIQVYDGKEGWMKRPYLNRDDWEAFSAEQAKSQVGKWDLDGPLLDYAAKGTKAQLESIESVQGRDAYKLKLTMKNGDVQHVWIDTQNYLDVKVEGLPRRMDGRMHTVWVYHRDFRPVQGLMVPFLVETAVDGYRDTHKMVIEKVGLNPALDDTLFARPKS